jgi:uncharacterized protein YndB with AHSA1/START domain
MRKAQQAWMTFRDADCRVYASKTWGERADLDARPGGRFAVDFGVTAAQGTSEAVDPPHRVVFTWGIPGETGLPPGASTVEVVLVPDGDGTVVELTHRDLPADREPAHREGWDDCLGALAARLAAPG